MAKEASYRILYGKTGSIGRIEGEAKLITFNSAQEIEEYINSNFKEFDDKILVTRETNAKFEIIFPRLCGVVTDVGGSLCHTAVVSREFGIPSIVGTAAYKNKFQLNGKFATKEIRDGSRVTLIADEGMEGKIIYYEK
jgi:pyruvate,water dikinase